MSRKMKIDKTLEQLKRLHENYKEKVDTFTTKRDQMAESLTYYSDLVMQTEDAINALEGKPTLKKMLEQALQKLASADITESQRAPTIAETANSTLPPAEKGFVWAKNEIGQDVLVAENLFNSESAQVPSYPSLPAIPEDEDFDSPEDLLK